MAHRLRDDFPDWAKFPRGEMVAHSDWLVLNLMEAGSRQMMSRRPGPCTGLRAQHPAHYAHQQEDQARLQRIHNTLNAKDIGKPRRYHGVLIEYNAIYRMFQKTV